MKEEYIHNIHELPATSGNSKDTEKDPFGSNYSGEETKAKNLGIKLTVQKPDNSIIHSGNDLLDEESMAVLRGLLKKANPEELKIMRRILCMESNSPELKAALTTLTEEIGRACK